MRTGDRRPLVALGRRLRGRTEHMRAACSACSARPASFATTRPRRYGAAPTPPACACRAPTRATRSTPRSAVATAKHTATAVPPTPPASRSRPKASAQRRRSAAGSRRERWPTLLTSGPARSTSRSEAASSMRCPARSRPADPRTARSVGQREISPPAPVTPAGLLAAGRRCPS